MRHTIDPTTVRGLLLAAAALLMAGCQDQPWQTRDISGLMSPLELELAAADGARLTQADLRGRAALLAFGYTSCPDVCPTTLARLASLQRRLAPELAEAVQIVFISVDPRRDTPEKLAAFTGYFDAGIRGLTGSEQQLMALTRRYRTTFGYGPADDGGFYEVTHSSGIYVFDRQGEARLLFRPDDAMEAMERDLTRLLEE